MVLFAVPLVTQVFNIPEFAESDRRTLFYTGAEIKQFKAEIRHMLKRRVFFDLKNTVVHTTPIVPGDQFGKLYYTSSELGQLEQDFVHSVKLEHADGERDDDDQKPIALLVLERSKLREKYVASIRNKLVKLKVAPPSTPAVEKSDTAFPCVEAESSLENPRRIKISSASTKTTTTRLIKTITGARASTSKSSSTSSTSKSRSRRSDSRSGCRSSGSGRGPHGLGLRREGSGITTASRRSSIEIAKKQASHRSLVKARAMAA